MKKVFRIGIFLAILGFSTLANAELIDNNNGLVYDTDRNITWYNPNISDMSWDQAMAWAEGLTVGGVTGWRLPSALNQDGSYPYYGYGVMESELGLLYHEELDNAAGGPLTNTGPFVNLQPINYWSSTVTARYAGNAFVFSFYDGKQGHADKRLIASFSAMAVHSGNVGGGAPAPTAEVMIDIKPWSTRNPMNHRKGHGILTVAIISAEHFDAPDEVDRDSLTFGVTGDEQSLVSCSHRPMDVHRDGSKDDLACHFSVEAAGFNCGDAEGVLKGKTLSGIVFEGRNLVRIMHCR